MITAAGAAAATGVRTFTATSSQGLVYGDGSRYTRSRDGACRWCWSTCHVPCRRRSRWGRITTTCWPPATRDSCRSIAETCQEVLDSVLMAYPHRRGRTPCMLCRCWSIWTAFILSFTREGGGDSRRPPQSRGSFCRPFAAQRIRCFRASQPLAQGVAVLDANSFTAIFRYQMHRAMEQVAPKFIRRSRRTNSHRLFGRRHADRLKTYRLDDAEHRAW